MNRLWFKFKPVIDSKDYQLISKLQDICVKEDTTSLKLELDYKIHQALTTDTLSTDINEFMCFDEKKLVGYIGIFDCGDKHIPIEVNGMVHPDYRRLGIFKVLFNFVVAEWKRRKTGTMLLLCDQKSKPGQAFIKKTGAIYKNTEYEMYLNNEFNSLPPASIQEVTFKKATNDDADEISRQNVIYFRDIHSSEDTPVKKILPEEEEKKGMHIYLAEKDGKVIGKVNLQIASHIGAIYGLGVLPLYRGKGYGRAIVLTAINKLKDSNVEAIMLQVDSSNLVAYHLYKSCGFIEKLSMNYYELSQNQ